jgi:conjugal transfer pilus assembly protein TraF
LLSISVGAAFAETSDTSNLTSNDVTAANEEKDYAEFFMDKERGWFWYEQLPEEVKEEILEKAQQSKESNKSKPEDEALSPAWFRKNFQRYQDAAVQHPHDIEAMRNYLYLEKFMRDRAEIFAYQRDKAVTSDPFLDESSRRSTASFGMKAMNINASENRKAILEKIGELSGVYYFFSGDDAYSLKQTALVDLLNKRYGFSIVPVRISGDIPKDFPWNNIIDNKGQAESLGIKKIPAIYLFNSNNQKVDMVTQGLYAMDEIEKRLVYSGERLGLISKEEAELVRPKDLYVDTEGRAGALGLPANAPKIFVELYSESIGN